MLLGLQMNHFSYALENVLRFKTQLLLPTWKLNSKLLRLFTINLNHLLIRAYET